MGYSKSVMGWVLLGCLLWSATSFLLPDMAGAVTPAPALTDREIAERLTRLETRLDEGLTGLRSDIAQLRADMQEQNRQLRADMNVRFEEHSRLILGILAAFAALFVVNVSLVVWDRRTAARPFEDKMAGIEEELADNRSQVSAVLEALRALGQQNQTVAAVLRRFNLL